MTLTRKDAAGTVFTILAVLVFVASHEGWNVWLVDDSHRWAAGVIGVLGIATCALGSPGRDTATRLMAVLGAAALVLAIVAIATGSLTPLSLLVTDIVLLWAGSTWRHARHMPHSPLSA
jgi:hypothetical protein